MINFISKKAVYVSSFVILLIIVVISVLSVAAGHSSPPFKQRAPVVFTHEAHTAYASGCMDCHHKYENGKNSENILDESDLEENYPDENLMLNIMSEGTLNEVRCGSCHNYKAKTDSRKAFHRQCTGCHERDGGPLMCGECHINSNTVSDGE